MRNAAGHDVDADAIVTVPRFVWGPYVLLNPSIGVCYEFAAAVYQGKAAP